MNRIALMLLIGMISLNAFAEETVYKYWVELTDKENSPYSVDRPTEFLSERAIARRKKQGISIQENDLPVNPAYVKAIEATGAQVLHTSRWFNAVTIRTTDESLIKEVEALDMVKSSRLLYKRMEFNTEKKNNSAMFELFLEAAAPKEPDNDTKYGFSKTQVAQTKADKMHAAGFKGEGMVIAVLDAGFYKMYKMETFDHLRKEGRLLGTWDFVEGDSIVYEDDMHGMNVLSCMAAYTEYEMIGTAPGASYWLIRTEDATTENPIEEANWVAGAEMADSAGADLINSSLGYTNYDDKSMSYSYKDLNGSSLISRAATMCARKGMIVCNAAGNEGNDDWHYVGVPADADSIVTVGGIDKNFKHSTFSSFGPTADGRIKPTVCAMATSTTVASSKNKFYPSQGTSFASPVMCGMIACLWQANPEATNMEVIRALEMSADRSRNPDNEYGYGVPNMEMANRILGGDKSFDYSTSRWLEELPDTYFDRVEFAYFSAEEQVIKIKYSYKKFLFKKRVTKEFKLKKGEFFYYAISDLPKKRKGITIEVTIGDETSTKTLNYSAP